MATTGRAKRSVAIDRLIGNRIRAVREERGLKQVDLAAGIGVTPNTMQRYEAGNISVTAYWLWKIASVLKVRVQDLGFEQLPTEGEVSEALTALEPLNIHASRMIGLFPKLPLDAQRAMVAFIGTLVEGNGGGVGVDEQPPG